MKDLADKSRIEDSRLTNVLQKKFLPKERTNWGKVVPGDR